MVYTLEDDGYDEIRLNDLTLEQMFQYLNVNEEIIITNNNIEINESGNKIITTDLSKIKINETKIFKFVTIEETENTIIPRAHFDVEDLTKLYFVNKNLYYNNSNNTKMENINMILLIVVYLNFQFQLNNQIFSKIL